MKKCKRILSVRNNSTPKNTGNRLCAFMNSGLIPVLFILILFLQVYSCGSPGGGGGGGGGGEISFDTPVINPFNLANVFLGAFPCFVDINNDGDLDAFIGEFQGNLIYFENTGNAGSPGFGAPSTNPFNLADVGNFSVPEFVDIDNDGDPDVFVGEDFGDTYYFENILY